VRREVRCSATGDYAFISCGCSADGPKAWVRADAVAGEQVSRSLRTVGRHHLSAPWARLEADGLGDPYRQRGGRKGPMTSPTPDGGNSPLAPTNYANWSRTSIRRPPISRPSPEQVEGGGCGDPYGDLKRETSATPAHDARQEARSTAREWLGLGDPEPGPRAPPRDEPNVGTVVRKASDLAADVHSVCSGRSGHRGRSSHRVNGSRFCAGAATPHPARLKVLLVRSVQPLHGA